MVIREFNFHKAFLAGTAIIAIVLFAIQQLEQDAHRDGKRFIGRSDECLAAFDVDDRMKPHPAMCEREH